MQNVQCFIRCNAVSFLTPPRPSGRPPIHPCGSKHIHATESSNDFSTLDAEGTCFVHAHAGSRWEVVPHSP
eukprot:2994209-Prymnesium_polylepis.1